MVDTVRTEAQLLVLFADNNSGNISAQDVRDFIVSIYDEDRKGEIKVSSNDTTKDTIDTKLIAGTNITLTENNDGGNETLTIAASGGGGGGGTVQGTDGTFDIQATDDGAPDGNARGEYSVDLQTDRSLVTQVASGPRSVLIGGANNTASANYAIVIGSGGSEATATYATVVGGSSSYVTRTYGSIVGGYSNTINNGAGGDHAAIVGGEYNAITADNAFIGAGRYNSAGGYCAATFGYRTTSSGRGSMAFGSSEYDGGGAGVISSGQGALAHGSGSYGDGAYDIQATGIGAHAHGSSLYENKGMEHGYILASGEGAHAGGFAGGFTIQATNGGSFAHGYSNNINHEATGKASVAFGYECSSTGVASFVMGREVTSSGDGAFGIGRESEAQKNNQLAQSSGEFDQLGDSQMTRVIMSRATTNATTTELTIGGGSPAAATRLTIDDEHLYDCLIRISGRQNTGVGHAGFIRHVLVERTGGTTALVGTVQTMGTDIGSNAGAPPAGWAVTITADNTNDFLDISVDGAAATNVRWTAIVEAVEIEYAD